MKFSIERFDPEKDAKPYFQDYDVQPGPADRMLLDMLIRIKSIDDSLSLRRSCREGVCGSDAMNINGKNGAGLHHPGVGIEGTGRHPPAAGTADHPRPDRRHDGVLQPVPLGDPLRHRRQSDAGEGAPAKPGAARRARRPLRMHPVRLLLDVCPSFWWNPDKFVGPAGLLNAYRFIADSRDQATNERLDNLEDPYRLFRCHTIMNCVDVCPKGLNPTLAIGKIKEMMVRRAV